MSRVLTTRGIGGHLDPYRIKFGLDEWAAIYDNVRVSSGFAVAASSVGGLGSPSWAQLTTMCDV